MAHDVSSPLSHISEIQSKDDDVAIHFNPDSILVYVQGTSPHVLHTYANKDYLDKENPKIRKLTYIACSYSYQARTVPYHIVILFVDDELSFSTHIISVTETTQLERSNTATQGEKKKTTVALKQAGGSVTFQSSREFNISISSVGVQNLNRNARFLSHGSSNRKTLISGTGSSLGAQLRQHRQARPVEAKPSSPEHLRDMEHALFN